MKKIFSLFLLGFFLIGLMSSPGLSQTAKEILERIIKAQGGRDVLENIKDSTLTGSMEIVNMGISGSITIYLKEPNKMRLDIKVMAATVIQAFDGKTAWGVNPQTGSVQEMPEKTAKYFKRQALGNDALLHPEKYGIAYAYKGKKKIEDKDYLELEQTYSDGHTVTIFIDPKTYLTFKTESISLNQMGVEVESETFVSDFRKINGLMIAHSMVTHQEGEEYMRMTIDEVSFNSNLEDSLFSMNE